MTPGVTAMLAGIFVVPLLLLWAGHRLRRRPARWRSTFWGGVAGHVLAVVIGSVAGMIPPEEWSSADVWRGALGLWSFMLLPLLGALIGWLRGPR